MNLWKREMCLQTQMGSLQKFCKSSSAMNIRNALYPKSASVMNIIVMVEPPKSESAMNISKEL